MSKYTTQLRFICESVTGKTESEGYDSIDDIVREAAPLVFANFPIFDEAYRIALETKILKHYYTREICEETYGLWKLRLDAKMNEIMPYYNKLYESELIEFNPLYDTDYHVEHEMEKDETRTPNLVDTSAVTRESSAETNTEGTLDKEGDVTEQSNNVGTTMASSNNWNLFSDTPQGGLKGIQDASDAESVAGNGYLTNATHVIDESQGSTTDNDTKTTTYDTTDTTNTNTTSTRSDSDTSTLHKTGTEDIESTESYIDHVYGTRSFNSLSKLLKEFRETFLNIDMMIIKDLEPLFFGLW